MWDLPYKPCSEEHHDSGECWEVTKQVGMSSGEVAGQAKVIHKIESTGAAQIVNLRLDKNDYG